MSLIKKIFKILDEKNAKTGECEYDAAEVARVSIRVTKLDERSKMLHMLFELLKNHEERILSHRRRCPSCQNILRGKGSPACAGCMVGAISGLLDPLRHDIRKLLEG